MIDITDGFTSISAGSDRIDDMAQVRSRASGDVCAPRSPTGARVVVEFRRDVSLAPESVVRVRYDFAGDGNLREGIGIAQPIRTVVRRARAVLYYYRLSYWIPASGLMPREPGCRRRDPGPPMASGTAADRANDDDCIARSAPFA